MNLYDMVSLKVDIPEENLRAGALGTIVHIFHEPNLAFEVEFADDQGRTLAMLPLMPDQIETHRGSD